MNEYVKTVIGVLIVSALIKVFVPKGNNEKLLNFLLCLFLLLNLIRPLISLAGSVKDFKINFALENYEQEDVKAYTKTLIENQTKSSVNSLVKKVLGEGAEDIEVSVLQENEEYSVFEITVYINEKYSSKAKALEEYINSSFGIRPKVILKEQVEYNG